MMTQTVLTGGLTAPAPCQLLYCEAATLENESVLSAVQLVDSVDSVDSLAGEKKKSPPAQPILKERQPRRVRAGGPGRPYRSLRRRGRERGREGRAAPDNTTQFLMSDQADYHSYSDCEGEAKTGAGRAGREVWAEQEFSRAYAAAATSRHKLSKVKLIEELTAVEGAVGLLERQYQEMTAQEQLKARLGAVEYDWEKGEVAMEPEVAEKIRIFQQEIAKLAEENRSLAADNLRLTEANRNLESSGDRSSDSSDSSSSSDSSDSSTDSESSDSETDSDTELEEAFCKAVPSSTVDCGPGVGRVVTDDTGYESGEPGGAVVTSTTLRNL